MIILASQSPRRAELLTQLQVPFSTIKVNVDETRQAGESPIAYVERLAKEKCQAGWDASDQQFAVLGADTIVVKGDEVLEKPVDYQDSLRMLSMLSDDQHQVLTSVAVRNADILRTCVVSTDVWFKSLSEQEIHRYWQTNEPQDKAGSYAIQGIAGKFVTKLEGSYSAVVGLPLYETNQLIKEVGVELHEC